MSKVLNEIAGRLEHGLQEVLELMVAAMGRRQVSRSTIDGYLGADRDQVVHFVPELATHYRSQRSYAEPHGNTQTTSIPGWDEDGALLVLNLCFESGSNWVEVVSWPEADPHVNLAAAYLVRIYAENRDRLESVI